ncbi:MAG: ABC transporter ATP-binding protein/permease [Candidatus Doudnabacteria bacterium]|nr:ABC transporter ATP-binding protein/permease [Candidatus Doudnabacteria bacterium]
MGSMWKHNPILNLFRFTWRYSEGNRPKVVLLLVLSLFANGLQLFDPILVSRAFNVVQFAPNDPGLMRHVATNLALLVAITIGFWILHGTSRVMEINNGFMVRKNYKQSMVTRVLSLPISWHKDHHSGDTIDKINKASDGLYEFSRLMFIITTNLVRLIGGIVAIWLFYPPASILGLIIAIVVFTTITQFDKKLRVGYKIIFKAENSLASAIHDYISNIITIITLRLKGRVVSEVDRRSMVAYEQTTKNSIIGETKWFITSLMLSIMISSALILNAYHSYTTTGVIVIGTLFALYQYLRRIGDTFFEFALRYGDMVKQDASVRAAEVLTEEFDAMQAQEIQRLPRDWKSIEIKDLFFQYSSEDDPEHKRVHLNNISIRMNRGERIALIGESGSGKSTLLSLLRGLYPARAKLLIDGMEMPYGLAYLYEHVTLIPQDPEIFNSTIEDNITMETKVDENDLRRAIELAQFKNVLTRMPKGLKTNVLEKGVSLSGGEKQRLALARGILAARNSDLLFMDEPTSSVDTQNELYIYENIFKQFPNTTIISAVHRLHLLRKFDRIYYFRDGEVIASGTLDDLNGNLQFKNLMEKYTVSPDLVKK